MSGEDPSKTEPVVSLCTGNGRAKRSGPSAAAGKPFLDCGGNLGVKRQNPWQVVLPKKPHNRTEM